MKDFKTFLKEENELLYEAKISEGAVEKVLAILIKMMVKRFGKMYRYGGEGGFMSFDDKGSKGFLYFTSKAKAIRFNYTTGNFVSASIWKKFKLGQKADFTVNFEGLNLLQIIGKIMDIFENPKTTEEEVIPMPESRFFNETEILTEARRATPEEFHQIIVKGLDAGENPEKLLWNRISDIAVAAGIQVPTVIKTMKTGGKGISTTYSVVPKGKDATATLDDPQSKPLNNNTYYIKVTAQDNLTKKFLSVKDDQEAQNITNKIQDMINNPSQEVVKQEMKDPNALFGIMADLTKLVIRKSRNALLVFGGGGVGKTHTILETLKEAGLVQNKDWFKISGKVTTASLYQSLFLHREGAILLFDDTDDIWRSEESANILKAALDSYDKRNISWYSNRTANVSRMSDEEKAEYNKKAEKTLLSFGDDTKVDDNGKEIKDKVFKLPSEFEYKGRILFISNLKKDDFDPAVLTRCAKIDMTLTPEQVFHRMETLIDNIGDPSVERDAKIEILQFLKDKFKQGTLDNPTFRTFGAACQLYKSGLPNWKDLLDYI